MRLDSSTNFERPADSRRLVEAVRDGEHGVELDWLEWKAQLDMSSKSGIAHVARVVIGMANRGPAAAQTVAEGFGYVVIGVEPGSLEGIEVPDPADFDNRLRVYLGDDGPNWRMQVVALEGTEVVVISVLPPKPGDPIHSLRKEIDGHRDGTVFVRRNGTTQPATSPELAQLQNRLLASIEGPPTVEGSLSVARSPRATARIAVLPEDRVTNDALLAARKGDEYRLQRTQRAIADRMLHRRGGHPDATWVFLLTNMRASPLLDVRVELDAPDELPITFIDPDLVPDEEPDLPKPPSPGGLFAVGDFSDLIGHSIRPKGLNLWPYELEDLIVRALHRATGSALVNARMGKASWRIPVLRAHETVELQPVLAYSETPPSQASSPPMLHFSITASSAEGRHSQSLTVEWGESELISAR